MTDIRVVHRKLGASALKLKRISAAVAAAAIAPAVLLSSPAFAADSSEGSTASAPDTASEAQKADGRKDEAPKGSDASSSSAKNASDEDNRYAILKIINKSKSGSMVHEAAQAAMNGSPEDRVRFLEEGYKRAQTTDLRLRTFRIMSVGGKGVKREAQRALEKNTHEALLEFLEVGQYKARDEDNSVEIARIISKAKPGSMVFDAAQAAMDGSPADRTRFLETGYELAQYGDDRLRTVQISSIGGKAVRKAAVEALRKQTHEALREFLEVGQYEARKLDEAKAAKGKGDKGGEKGTDGQESKDGKGSGGDKQQEQTGARNVSDAHASHGTTGAKPAVASVGTGSSGAQLAATGASSATPWIVGGSAAALTAGAGLVIASRRRTADEH
ncbi:ALF repeat-containing protein [Streptomyces sp. NPDC001339]|uniref:ALF repeat-containing protein n=1 Tax=Streptomyces sp. NPDC001339 TaxID=3364563 RepID=UPI0036C16374